MGDLTFVEASYNSAQGMIEVSWKKEDGVFVLNTSIPEGCTARVYLPESKDFITVNGGNYTFKVDLEK